MDDPTETHTRELTDDDIARMLNDPPRPGSSVGNIGALVITLLIFAGTGLFDWSAAELVTLVLVILFHECGHLVAMKAFGYRDLRMLFLPFLGAMVSGRPRTNRSYEQAVVSLAGPVPGIVLGFFLLFTGNEDLQFAANLLLFLNLFNLLPVYPLDGGRFLDDLLFSRNYHAEMVSKVVASVCIVVIAVYLQWWMLLIVLLGTLGSLKTSSLVNSTMNHLRHDPEANVLVSPEATGESVRLIRKNIDATTAESFRGPADLIRHIGSVWTRLSTLYPGPGLTAALLSLYGLCILVGASLFI